MDAKPVKKPAKKSAKKQTDGNIIVVPPKIIPPTPINAVKTKYQENMWTVITAPTGGINDLIASKEGKLHYIQVVTPESYKEPKYHGECKNNFIQNAFSNSAVPIIATVTVTGSKAKIVFEDVNMLKSVCIGRKKAEKKTP